MTTTTAPSDDADKHPADYNLMLRLVQKLACTWADQIEHMQPLAAQQFISTNIDMFMTKLSDDCGADFNALLVASIERAVWEIYDQKHKRVSLA